jgi:hypothetical protein
LLLQFQYIEKSLVVSGEIDEAKEMHGHLEQRRQREIDDSQEQLWCDYESSRAKLCEKQRMEVEAFENAWDHERKLLEAARDKDLERVTNRENVIGSMETHWRCRTDGFWVKTKPTMVPRTGGMPVGSILPPLIPPNDPHFLEKKRQQRKDKAKRSGQFQKRNAEEILAQYQFVPPPEPPKEEKEKTTKARGPPKSPIPVTPKDEDEIRIGDGDGEGEVHEEEQSEKPELGEAIEQNAQGITAEFAPEDKGVEEVPPPEPAPESVPEEAGLMEKVLAAADNSLLGAQAALLQPADGSGAPENK